MNNKTVIILDCGATNVRAVAVDQQGKIIAHKSFPNKTHPDPHFGGGVIWDVNEIWNSLIKAIRKVLAEIKKEELAGITVTTFGVDGAPMMKSGELIYPVISWACQRTAPIMDNIGKYIPPERLYEINGVNKFSFNTINKFIWFKENMPEILERMDHFVFMPSIFIHKLTGNFVTDTTMAGTSMMTDLKTREFSDEVFNVIGTENKFPYTVEPGDIVGKLTSAASKETGLPEGLPVIATGHDTQFALYGAGAEENEVVLSSGTWEILMARTAGINIDKELLKQGVTVEFDAKPGLYNPGLQWLGSGILEWVKRMFYSAEQNDPNIYDLMIREAENADPGKINVGIDFLNEEGILSGLGLNTKREEIYRATLDALAKKTKQSLEILEQAGGFQARSLIVVGGGSKNRLWNQFREKELGIPLKTIEQKETTVLGAAKILWEGLEELKIQ